MKRYAQIKDFLKLVLCSILVLNCKGPTETEPEPSSSISSSSEDIILSSSSEEIVTSSSHSSSSEENHSSDNISSSEKISSSALSSSPHIISYSSFPSSSNISSSSLHISSSEITTNPNIQKLVNEYNYVLGTQTIAPLYSHSTDGVLVETAKQIKAMGSNVLKISLSPWLYSDLHSYSSYDYQFKKMISEIPDFKTVIDMDFKYYMFWVDDAGSFMDDQGMTDEEISWQKQKLYDLTEYLLTTYNNSGKIFFLGNWEGDWQLLKNTETNTYNPLLETLNPLRVSGMIDWVNARQQAVDSAKVNTPHSNVEVYHYLELNRVADAINGKERIANTVLPHVDVDFVSYSAYDIPLNHTTYEGLYSEMSQALDYVEAALKPKTNLPFSKRVWIGEYGYKTDGWWDWGDQANDLQNHLSRNMMTTCLEWGTPFCLYWQMYDNEYDATNDVYAGYWLIDHNNVKQPTWHTHSEYYTQIKEWLTQYINTNNTLPSELEFKEFAVSLVKTDGVFKKEEP